ncbi:hypothetical protein QBC38DRAFT_502893 [Podospora fimiseda]|uniref:Beta-mannosidase B n=1 Tax=Podospora fimiseda TaxID=252190 RepID=A0AAN7BHY9_9PEZI|nr:hypothetical protein QBC38DRAFT_502893 [Podospora fimiseda]
MEQPRDHVKYMNSGWKFKRLQASNEEWQHVQAIPCNVHSELINKGKIPDPFVNLNELDVSWVGEETWQYRTIFRSPENTTGNKVDLVFEGLDTFVTVKLNNITILTPENMFVEHRVNISHCMAKDGEDNILDIIFEPARQKRLEIVNAHPEHDFIVHQTEFSRGPVRKAQYHWGWDRGPILMTVGPWKPIRLETYQSFDRIENCKVNQTIWWTDKGAPFVEFTVEVDIFGSCAEFLEICLISDYQSTPQLWWPRGYGSPNLYVLCLTAADSNNIPVATHDETVGFRKAELIQAPDSHGESFYFRINNIDMFVAGSNWIPADSFLSKLEQDPFRYIDWVTLLAQGNQNMIRIWGGGIYEHRLLYQTCDELGILVWQDFMFACASYPTYPDFLSSIRTEALQALRRLRHHPSIILWCGNNEDYQLIERYNLDYNFADKDPESWLKTNFPARYIYEHLLPSLVSQETNNSAIYRPSSPWGNGISTTLKLDQTVGDIHQWDLWHGEAKPYQLLPEMSGRFVSEFGMQAYPHLETINKFVTDEKERYPGSKTMNFHNKAVGHERRLMTYLSENFRVKMDLKGYVHLTQVLQADAVGFAYKTWRRQWKDRNWSVVDYYLVKKPAWYAIKRAMKPVAVGVMRKFFYSAVRPADGLWRRDTGHVDPRAIVDKVEFDVWVSISELKTVKAWLGIRFMGVNSGMDVKKKIELDLEIEGNGTTEVLVGHKFEWDEGVENEPFVIHASLWIDGVEVSSDVSWPDPIKYLEFKGRGAEVKYVGENFVEMTVKKPVKGFVFSERQGVELSDNGFDAMPWEKPIRVKVEGIKAEELDWTFVGQE